MDLLSVGRTGLKQSDIVMDGGPNVDCIEVGGPKPGVGCAGRGLGRLFEELEDMNIFDEDYDYIFYDVLGDVVCGGFAVPMRSGYAEEVYVVTSGEFMSLYAANNIARGIQNYANEGDVRMGGLIANVKDLAYDRELIEKFAERIGTHVVYYLEWNRVVYEAERRRQTVVRYKPDDAFTQTWFALAEAIESNKRTHIPAPMEDNELDVFLENLFGFSDGSAGTHADRVVRRTGRVDVLRRPGPGARRRATRLNRRDRRNFAMGGRGAAEPVRATDRVARFPCSAPAPSPASPAPTTARRR